MSTRRALLPEVQYGNDCCRILAGSFGRAGQIYPGLTKAPLPLAIDDEYLSTTEEGRQPDGIPSRLELVHITAKTLEVVDEMRNALRAPSLKIKHWDEDVTVPDPTAVLRVNSQIDDLFQGLPPHLRVNADYSKMPLNDDEVKFFRIQTHAIRFRLLTVRVFLLRPSLLAEGGRWTTGGSGFSQTASSALQERLHLEICGLCLKTINDVLEEIQRGLTQNGGISAWFALHCKLNLLLSSLITSPTDLVGAIVTVAAGAVLPIVDLSPILSDAREAGSAEASWERAMDILEFYKPHISSVERGIEILKGYRESIRRRAAARLSSS